MNTFLFSLILHGTLLWIMGHSRKVNIPRGIPIQVILIEKHERAPILPTQRKPLKTGSGSKSSKTHPKIDLKDYSDRLKAIIDPIFVAKMGQNNYHNLNVILLLSVNSYGKIVNVVVQKSSGNKGYDKIAVDSIWEAKEVPPPPEELVKLGIEWSFST